MRELELLIVLILAAIMLAAAARRVGAPYPVFLALGGAVLTGGAIAWANWLLDVGARL